MAAFDAGAAARHLFEAHRARAPYANLPAAIAPQTLGDGYAAQEALGDLFAPTFGAPAGLKIATTTKVMQALMGIDHPCGGVVFERRVHRSPATLRLADYQHLMIECELALRIDRDLPAGAEYTAATVAPAVAAVMPAFELIEDRHANYKQTQALTLIAENCWNAGVVLGEAVPFDRSRGLAGIEGVLSVNGAETHRGATDDALATLAWVANLACWRERPLRAGMFVITGSVIATLPIQGGDRFSFRLDGIGAAELTAE